MIRDRIECISRPDHEVALSGRLFTLCRPGSGAGLAEEPAVWCIGSSRFKHHELLG